MRMVLFLSRVAFICNIFFTLSVLVQISGIAGENEVLSTAVMTGFLMAALLNPLLIILYMIALLRRRISIVPKWLVWSNFLFFLLQIGYVLYLNNFHKKIPV